MSNTSNHTATWRDLYSCGTYSYSDQVNTLVRSMTNSPANATIDDNPPRSPSTSWISLRTARECSKNGKWLFDKNGNAKSPNELTKDVLNPAYDIDASAASKLFKFLGIADSKDDKFARVEAILDESNFSIRDKENTMFAMEIVNDGFTKEDYEAFKAWKRINEIATPAPIAAYTNSRKAYTSTTNTKTDDASESTEQSDTPDNRISSLDRILRELEAQYRVISDNQTDDASESTEQSDAPDECESSLGRILREIEARRLEQIEKRPKADGDDQIDDDVTIDSRDEQFLYLIETAKYHFDALRNILNEIKRLYIS